MNSGLSITECLYLLKGAKSMNAIWFCRFVFARLNLILFSFSIYINQSCFNIINYRTAIVRSGSSGRFSSDEESLAVAISLSGFTSTRASGRRGGRRRRWRGSRRRRRGGRRRRRSRRYLESAAIVIYPLAVAHQRRDVTRLASAEEIRRQFQCVGPFEARSTFRSPAERVSASGNRFHRRSSATTWLVYSISAIASSGRPPAASSSSSPLVSASSIVAASSSAAALAPAATRRSSGSPRTAFDSHGARFAPSPSARRRLQLRQVWQDVQHAAWTRGMPVFLLPYSRLHHSCFDFFLICYPRWRSFAYISMALYCHDKNNFHFNNSYFYIYTIYFCIKKYYKYIILNIGNYFVCNVNFFYIEFCIYVFLYNFLCIL